MEKNFNILHKEQYERLLLWKNLRKSLVGFSDEEQIKMVINFWKGCSLVGKSLDWTSPETWGTPWENIYDGKICRNMICFLMEQTFLVDNNWDYNRFKLYVIYDKEIDETYMICVIDDNYVLNYNYNRIEYLNNITNYDILEIYKPISINKHVSVINNINI